MLKQFVVKHYKILFRSKFFDGIIFLLLFLSGLARYRAALVISATGFSSAFSQYLLDNGPKRQIPSYELLQRGFVPAILVALLFDYNYGQIFPIYSNLPIWLSLLSVIGGYVCSFMILYIESGHLVQWLSDDEVFVVCPNCSFENIRVTEKCGHCGYSKDLPLDKYVYDPLTEALTDDLKIEIKDFKEMGMYTAVPKEITRALKLENSEIILTAMKSPTLFYYGGVKKNNERMRPGWFILTNKRIISYYGWLGWTGIDMITFKDIINAQTVLDKVAYTKKRWLEIKDSSNTYRFLFNTTTKHLCKRIMFFEADKQLALDCVLKSINKRYAERQATTSTAL